MAARSSDRLPGCSPDSSCGPAVAAGSGETLDGHRGQLVFGEYAITLAQETRARLVLLYVVELPIDVLEPPNPALINYRAVCFEQARAQMTKAVRAAAARGVSTADLVVEGRAYRQILQTAAEQHADLIVMGVEGRRALDMFFLGSTTKRRHKPRQIAVALLRPRHDLGLGSRRWFDAARGHAHDNRRHRWECLSRQTRRLVTFSASLVEQCTYRVS